jgi:hypothetical protein
VFEEQGRLEAGGFDMFVSVVASVAHTMIIHCLADKRQCSTCRGRVGGLEQPSRPPGGGGGGGPSKPTVCVAIVPP